MLPQVAVEYNGGSTTFLKETCHKAGLPAYAWKDEDVKTYVFSADIFGSKGFWVDETEEGSK